jgi:hypothetical protein
MDIELISQLVIEYLTKVAEMKSSLPKHDLRASDLKWLEPEDRKQLREWGTALEVEGNPPKWAQDPAKWKRAKKVVKKYWKRYKTPYMVVAHVYENMGGRVKKHKGKKKH